MDPILAQIMLFAGNFAPRGWAFCHGQLLPISQHSALYSLLGTTYGGDGRSTFALPDLRGRAAVGSGAGAGLSPVALGQRLGAENQSLSVDQLPPHDHTLSNPDVRLKAFAGANADSNDPGGRVLGSRQNSKIYSPNAPDVDMNAAAVSVSGGSIGATGAGQPFDNRPPGLGLNYVIALQGIYPSRS